MKEGYIERDKRKKVLFLCDDIRFTSGISTMAREIVIGTAHRFNWVNVGGSVKHPEEGKRLDLSADTNKFAEIEDSSVIIYPTSGYGNPDLIRQIIKLEKPDILLFFTDPRYWIWLFQMEHEIRKSIPMVYLNIWDDLPYPMYNKPYYESCDALLAISKQTENINRFVLGDLANEKIIKYVPHGINEKLFYPIKSDNPEYLTLLEAKKEVFKGKEYDFVLMFNSRNIRRKSVPDTLLAYKIFCDKIGVEKAKKCAILLHTSVVDENGTDLAAVTEMLFANNEKENYNIIFSDTRIPTQVLNLLYNLSDAIILLSSNEGWGLSLTEAMMCGKPIIANVTGGMQDQMRFEDENMNWISFNEEFGSNHRGKYKNHGSWAFPVFPSNISLIGSVPTPYIFDDRVNPAEAAVQIEKIYNYKINRPDLYEMISKHAREWVTSDESMMSSRWMCKNVISALEETLEKWEVRHKFELVEVDEKELKHYIKYPIY